MGRRFLCKTLPWCSMNMLRRQIEVIGAEVMVKGMMMLKGTTNAKQVMIQMVLNFVLPSVVMLKCRAQPAVMRNLCSRPRICRRHAALRMLRCGNAWLL